MQKILSFDVLRVIALLQIVMVHASAYVVIYYPDTVSAEFIQGNILNGIG
ncbi:MAG: hypothetical protein ACI4UM_01540 [Succinivibrio sp.]